MQLTINSLAEGGGGIHCVTQQQPAVRADPGDPSPELVTPEYDGLPVFSKSLRCAVDTNFAIIGIDAKTDLV